MKKKRIGNDIAFAWTIVDKEGHPYSLVGKDLTLTLSSALGCNSIISPFTIGGDNMNVVMWTFYGKDQKTLGKYTATLVENLGDIGMKTVDKIDAIYLVAHTYQEGGEDSCSHLATETVELTSAIETAAKGDPGDPAGFGEVTASVDGGVGTPSVEVTTSGPNTAKNFAFAFHNLKGQDGSDAEVTSQNIQSALGYVPVAPSDISQFITKTVDDLTNYYLKSETYTKAEVEALVAGISGVSFVVANSLPTASASTMGKIYLIPSADPQTQNVKDEFITLESGGSYSWEQIGSTAIDLDGYVTDAELQTAIAAKQDVISDLATIRSGAAAGATAYQKPGDGIPGSDLDETAQGSLAKAESAVQPGVNNAKLQVLVEALVSIVTRVSALEVRQDRLGAVKAASVDANEITRFQAPLVLYGHGVPAAATIPVNWPTGLPWDGIPYFVGQLYINMDAASAGVYYAINNTAVSGWKNA